MKYPHPTLEIWVEEEEEEVMYTEVMNSDYRDTEAYTQRRHMLNRLRDITWEKEQSARKTFGLEDDDHPSSGTEMLQRIKDGRYTLEKIKAGKGETDYIRWRDPNLKEDSAGFQVYLDKLFKAKQAATDEITVMPPQKGLETLRAFEAIAVQ